MERVTFAVHDLVRVDPARRLGRRGSRAPAWVAASLQRAPWVVVRRSDPKDGIAVGVRGPARTERYATQIIGAQALARCTPEGLCTAATRSQSRLGAAARHVSREAARENLRWGPVGSFGFELASGCVTTTPTSDFDIVIRATGAARSALLRFHGALREVSAALGVVFDAELAYEFGGIALAEYVTLPDRVLAKTPRGPQFVACP